MTSFRSTKKQIALVGDRHCGKTSLAVRLSSDLFLDYYYPTQSVDDFTAEVVTGKYTCKLTLLDIAGACESEDIRSLAYENCNAVVVCFDLTDATSLENITIKWLPELEEKCPGVPFILAGCKLDRTCVTDHVGVCPQLTRAREAISGILTTTSAKAYIECSSKFMDGVEELTQLVVGVTEKKRTTAKKVAASIKSRLLKNF